MLSMDLYAKGARKASKNYNKKHTTKACSNLLDQCFMTGQRNKV